MLRERLKTEYALLLKAHFLIRSLMIKVTLENILHIYLYLLSLLYIIDNQYIFPQSSVFNSNVLESFTNIGSTRKSDQNWLWENAVYALGI